MAVIVSTLFSTQGVAATTIMEGRAVTLTASGARQDLPNVVYASANQQRGYTSPFSRLTIFRVPPTRICTQYHLLVRTI